MALHPFRNAFTPDTPPASADDISQAVETFALLRVGSLDDVTTRNLDRTFAFLLVTTEGYFVYSHDPDSTDEPDGLTLVHDSEDRPFVRVGTSPGGGFTPRGAYDNGTTYELLDLVADQGSSWVYLNATPGDGNAPPTLPTTANAHWQIVAQQGPQGPAGQDFVPDAVVALIAGRAAYDEEVQGFSVLVESDAGNGDAPTLYFKLSAASADWSGGFTFNGLSREDLFGFVDPAAAEEDSGDITCDLADGTKLFFTRTLADNETLLAPENAPTGSTFYLLADPNGNTLAFDTGYEGVGDALPDIASEALLVIVVAGASRFLVHVVGQGYGDGT